MHNCKVKFYVIILIGNKRLQILYSIFNTEQKISLEFEKMNNMRTKSKKRNKIGYTGYSDFAKMNLKFGRKERKACRKKAFGENFIGIGCIF